MIIPEHEITIDFARSSGPGGQNVNKLNTKAQLRWHIGSSAAFTQVEKNRIRAKLHTRITVNDELVVSSEAERSQEQNKMRAIELLNELVTRALIVPKKRIPTRPTRASKIKRVESKVHRSKIKRQRQMPDEF